MNFLDHFKTVSHYHALEHRFRNIEGWLAGLEGYALLLAAAYGPGNGEIVEIGSWKGKSTCWLAEGSKMMHREKIHAIDPFDGGPMLKHLVEAQEHRTTYHIFVDNLINAGLFDYVEPIVDTSQQAIKNWNKPIRLLFIDGEHTYEAVKADFEMWAAFLVPEGLVAFDDVTGQYEGARRYYDGLLESDSCYQEVLQVGKMKIIQRIR